MSVLIDARPHAEAIKAAVKVQLGPNNAYDQDEVPGANGNAGTLPNIYVIVHVERRYNPLLRSGQAGSAGWRVSLRCVGRTVDEARWAMFKAATALNEKRLTVGGKSTSPIQFENDEQPALDDGRYSALSRFTYSH